MLRLYFNIICKNIVISFEILRWDTFQTCTSLESNIMWYPKGGCCNPTLKECEDETHIPEMGIWESTGTPKTLEFDGKGQKTSHWSVLYIIGKLLKCRCRKWACMSHLDICNTNYGKKKGQKLNRQFDSRPLKVRNRPDSDVCRWSVIHHWKALNESYKFALNLVPIKGLSKKL